MPFGVDNSTVENTTEGEVFLGEEVSALAFAREEPKTCPEGSLLQ